MGFARETHRAQWRKLGKVFLVLRKSGYKNSTVNQEIAEHHLIPIDQLSEGMSRLREDFGTCGGLSLVQIRNPSVTNVGRWWGFLGKNTGVGSHTLLLGIFRPRDRAHVCSTAGRFLTIWATRYPPLCPYQVSPSVIFFLIHLCIF